MAAWTEKQNWPARRALALRPEAFSPYEPTALTAGIGAYRDEYAVAAGVFHCVRFRLMLSLGASFCSDGDLMARTGVSMRVGRGGKKKPELAGDAAAMGRIVAEMREELEQLKEKDRRKDEKLERLEEENRRNKETIRRNEETIEELRRELKK